MIYPSWHIEFMNARNLLVEACNGMEQAANADRKNKDFKILHEKMLALLHKVDTQLGRNFKRGKKEGWMK